MKANLLLAVLTVGALGVTSAACGSSNKGSGGTTGAGTTVTGSGTSSKSVTSATGGTTTSTGGTMCAVDVCKMYGAAVPQVASDIVDAAAANAEFQPFFANLGMPGHDTVMQLKTNLAAFIAVAYKCAAPSTYMGKSMLQAHTGLNINSQTYDDFIALIAGVLKKDGVAQADIANCFAPPLVDPAFKATIVGH